VVWALGLLRPYIEGTNFLIRCDHKALKWILPTTACTNNRRNRWRIPLSEFDYDVEYKPGPQHVVDNALSRVPTEGLDTGPVSQEIPTVGVTTRSWAVLDPRLPENRETAHIPLEEQAQKQEDEEICQEVKRILDTSESTRFYQNADGLLCREGHRAGSQQVLIPRSLVEDVLRAEHSSPLTTHPGGSRMYQTKRNHYYWPSLAAYVFGWAAACSTCAKNRLMGTQSTASMRLFPATELFAALAIDLLNPLPRTPEGCEYILVICDRFTKVTRAVRLKAISALDVLSAFLDTSVASYGIPDSVLSDSGPQFAAVLWQGVLKALGIDTNYATPYHPQTNGQVERFNKTLVKQLRHYVNDHVVTWSRYLRVVVTAYISQVHGSTGHVPFAFVSPGRLTPVAIELLTARADTGEVVTPVRAKEHFLRRLDALIPLVRDAIEKAQARYKRAFDKRVQARREALRVGDWVFVKSHENQGGKLFFKTLGPYQVLKTDGRRLTIESDDGIRTINGNHATRAPEPPEGDPAWARALAARHFPPFPHRLVDRLRLSSATSSDRGTTNMNDPCSRYDGSGMDPGRTPGTMWRTSRLRRFAKTECDTDSRCEEGYQTTNP